VLNNRAVSRTHAGIREFNGEYWIFNLSESNGTVLNGWLVEQSPGSTEEMWVLDAKEFRGFLEKEQSCLAPEDIELASFHLTLYIRAREKEPRSLTGFKTEPLLP
jgi:pSer/pThr/pTyr-binding forkhead associated (FHA) protein